MASERGLKLAGWEDGFWDGYEPLLVEDLSRGDVYVNPWNNIWEWGSGSNAYKYANAGYKVFSYFMLLYITNNLIGSEGDRASAVTRVPT